MARPRDSARLKIIKNSHHGARDDLESAQDATVDVLPITPEPPEWLHPYAKLEWDRVATELHRKTWLGTVDVTLLARYCQAYARWRVAEADIDERGDILVFENDEKGQRWEKQNPSVAIAQKWADQMEKCATKFGISPDARRGWVEPKRQQTARERMLAKKDA